jgi:hypothetical protein
VFPRDPRFKARADGLLRHARAQIGAHETGRVSLTRPRPRPRPGCTSRASASAGSNGSPLLRD